MPLPKGINDPAVRAAWIASRRGTVAAFDQLVNVGTTTTQAARQLGFSVAGIKCMRRSIESLEDVVTPVAPWIRTSILAWHCSPA